MDTKDYCGEEETQFNLGLLLAMWQLGAKLCVYIWEKIGEKNTLEHVPVFPFKFSQLSQKDRFLECISFLL